MPSDGLWAIRSPRIARRDVLKTMTAAGFAVGLLSWSALAQDKSAAPPALAEILARYAASLKL